MLDYVSLKFRILEVGIIQVLLYRPLLMFLYSDHKHLVFKVLDKWSLCVHGCMLHTVLLSINDAGIADPA